MISPRRFSSAQSLNAFYQMVHRSLDKILFASNFYIALHHPSRDSITFPFYVDEKDENPGEIFDFSQTASLAGRVISHQTAPDFL